MAETVLDSPCPVCGKRGLIYRAEELKIPHFGNCLQTTIICPHCGFRHADIMMLDIHDPMRYEISIESERDLSAKVIRSTSGTITIPEIGAKLEPGPLSEAFITNVEGLLNRFVDILVQLMHDTPEKLEEIREVLRKIGYIRHGRERVTVILEDPLGNSAIIGEHVRKRKLTEEEVKNLKLGEITLSLRGLNDLQHNP